MKRRGFLVGMFGWLPWFRDRTEAKEADMATPEIVQNDLALILFNEFLEWYRSLAAKGTLPRAFTGVTNDGKQAIIILADLPLDHVHGREFLIWLCRNERFVAYAYGTRVGIADDSNSFKEGLDIYASSERYDVSTTFDIERQKGGTIQLTEGRHFLFPSNPSNGIFFGLQHPDKSVRQSNEVIFHELWHALRPKAMWRQR